MQTLKRYAWIVFSFYAVAVIGLTGLNLAFSPYDVRDNDRNDRLFRSYHVLARSPAVAVFGSSRADQGISPSHSGFDPTLESRFSLALGGAKIDEIEKMFQHWVRFGEPKQAIIALDMFMFDVHSEYNLENKAFLYEETGEKFRIATYFKYFFINARDVYQYLFGRREKGPQFWLADGQRNWEHTRKRLTSISQRQAFHRSETEFVSTTYFPHGEFCFCGADGKGCTFAALRRILSVAAARDIDIRIVLSPVHARQLELLDNLGLWVAFETWKRRLTRLVAQVREETHGARIELWDFSTYNLYSVEPVPLASNRRKIMQWYIESSHYRSTLGDLMLDRVLLGEGSNAFGVRLTNDTIEGHLHSQHEKREAYRNAHADEVADVATVFNRLPPKQRKVCNAALNAP
jgi:hypothetical protein